MTGSRDQSERRAVRESRTARTSRRECTRDGPPIRSYAMLESIPAPSERGLAAPSIEQPARCYADGAVPDGVSERTIRAHDRRGPEVGRLHGARVRQLFRRRHSSKSRREAVSNGLEARPLLIPQQVRGSTPPPNGDEPPARQCGPPRSRAPFRDRPRTPQVRGRIAKGTRTSRVHVRSGGPRGLAMAPPWFRPSRGCRRTA